MTTSKIHSSFPSRASALVLLLFVALVFFACNPPKNQITCGNDPALLPEKGKMNEIDFKRTGVSESDASALTGFVYSLRDDEPLAFVSIVLQNNVHRFTASSDLDGRFYLKNVNPGSYQFITRSSGHRELIYDSIQIESGGVYKLDIKLGFIGKDEKARK